MESIAYDGNTLYGGGRYGGFYEIDITDGTTTLIASTSFNILGMEYHNGVLYGGSEDGTFYSINPETGARDIISEGDSPIQALAVNNDIMYGNYFDKIDGSGDLSTYDIYTGSRTVIGGEGAHAMAPMTAPPVVPEPISSALFLIGGAAMGFRRFRKA